MTPYVVLKRLFDLILAVISLIMLAPLFGIIALAILLDSPGPVFYKGSRIGKDAKPFKIYKFRTMVVHADQMGSALTSGGDPRVTRMGRILRKFKTDELPQLINVLLGEMSVVGPRPESPGYVALYNAQQSQVLNVQPGITGLTQIQFRNEEALLQKYTDAEEAYIEMIMPYKLSIDMEYIAQRSFLYDLRLIAETVVSLFRTQEPEIGLPSTSGTEAPAVQ